VTGRGSAVGVSQVIPDLDGMIVSTGEFDRAHWTGRSNVWTCGSYDFTTNRRTEQMVNNDALVRQLYEGFNRRDIPAVLTLLAENVDWANGMDGGHVHGRDAVRAYWTKQWAAIAPQVDPMHVTQRDDGATAVEVHQVVRDLEGRVLLDETVRHVFQIDKGLVTRFDIENAGRLSAIAHY
jgi:ketosteroid isomerase-like protein